MIRAASKDKDVLNRVPFKEYLAMLTRHLAGIAGWFGTGAGLWLQYEDSVLALDVLRRMEDQAIPVLPVHDSFIVAEEHEERLRLAMETAFHRYGIVPQIERKGPEFLGK